MTFRLSLSCSFFIIIAYVSDILCTANSEAHKCASNKKFIVSDNPTSGPVLEGIDRPAPLEKFTANVKINAIEQPDSTVQIKSIHLDTTAVPIQSIPLKSESASVKDTKTASHQASVTDESSSVTPADESEPVSADSDPTLSLPPLEDAAAGGIEQHQIPTFNEFHAMLSENDNSKSLKGGTNEEQPRLPTVLEEKQDDLPLRTDQFNVPVVPDPGSSRFSQSDLPHEQESGNKRIVDITESPGIGAGAPHRISDSPSLTDQAIKSMDSQTGRSDKAKLTPGPTLENSRSSDTDSVEPQRPSQQDQHRPTQAQPQPHFQNNQVVTDRSVTLRRNVASVACGAKLLESSPSMKNAEAVLNSNNDEYMNVPCSSEKWFVLEVCEPVQLRMVELANYELFSSRVKSFNVFVSDRFPAKSWDLVGQFMARDLKGLQNFHVSGEKLIKYVKFELLEHYGSEHYCPLTMIRLFGLVSDDLDDEVDDADAQVAAESSADSSATGVGGHRSDIPPGGTIIGDSGVTDDDLTDQFVRGSSSPFGESDQSALPKEAIDKPSGADPEDTTTDSPRTARTKPSVTEPRSRKDLRSKSHRSRTVEPRIDSHDSIRQVSIQDGLGNSPSTSIDESDSAITNSPTEQSIHCPSPDEDHCLITGDPGESDKSHPAVPQTHSSDQDTVNSHRSAVETAGLDIVTTVGSAQQDTNARPPGSTSFSASDIPVHSSVTTEPNRSQGTFFQRAKDFLTNWVSSAVSSFLHRDFGEEMEVNLSHVPICSRHLEAVDSLQSYGLLNTSCQMDPSHLSPRVRETLLFSQLEESKQLGLMQLERCLFYLQNLTQPTDLSAVATLRRPYLGVGLTVSFSELRLKQYPGLRACLDASKRLNLALSQSSEDGTKFRYSLSRLFVAFHYRERQRARSNLRFFLPRTNSAHDLAVVNIDPQTSKQYDPFWHIFNPDSLRWVSQCARVPDFLLTTEDPVPDSTSSPFSRHDRQSDKTDRPRIHSVPLTDKFNVNHSPSYSWISRRNMATREEIVVPAALTGSRKDTLLMRLNNRVRLLERNVSVSMRYLEELSQSYRRQMERLSRSFNLTTIWLKATAQGAAERDQLQQARIDELESRLANLASRLLPDKSVKSSSADSNDSVSSVKHSSQAQLHSLSPSAGSSNTLPTAVSPPLPPPPPAFDAPLDWTATYGPWPQIEDEWLDEDGVVETEGEDDIVDNYYIRASSHLQSTVSRNRYDGRAIDTMSRNEMFPSTSLPTSSSTSDSSSRSRTSSSLSPSDRISGFYQALIEEAALVNELIDWMQSSLYWFSVPWSHFSWVLPKHWVPFEIPLSSNTIGMIYMVFLHLMFAILSHLVIYWVWLRPCSRKFQCDLLTLHSSPQLTSSGSPYYTPQYTTASRRTSEQPALTKHKDLHTQVLNRKNKQPVQVNSNKPVGVSQLVNVMKSNHTVSMNPVDGHPAYSRTEVSTYHSPTRKSVELKSSPLITGSAPTTPHVTQIPCFFSTSDPSIEISSCVSKRLSEPMSVNKTNLSGKISSLVTSNQTVSIRTPNSNYIPGTNATDYHLFHCDCNGCDGTDRSQTPSVSSSSTLDRPKLSKNAIRRRNRRERAKQKDQLHLAQQGLAI